MGRSLRRVGKLDGPDARTKNVTWLDIMLLPFIFFGRAAITFLTILFQFNYKTNITRATKAIDIIWDSTSEQVMLWFFIILWAIFRLYPVKLCFWLMSVSFKITFYTLFGIPIVFCAFFKSVYNFGPKHYRQRGLWEIITEPVPTNSLEIRPHKKKLFGSTRQRPALKGNFYAEAGTTARGLRLFL